MATPKLIHHFLEKNAREEGGHPCLIEHGHETWSYSDINALANRFGHFLRAFGIRGGDRVAILLRNSHQYVAAYYGTLKAGGVAVPLNTTWSMGDIAWTVNHCKASLLITGGRLVKTLKSASVVDQVPCYCVGGSGETFNGSETLELEGFGSDNLDQEIQPEANAMILYTSGSTGVPKGVVLSHRGVVTNTFSILDYLKLNPADKVLAILPFYYVYGKSVLNTHLCAGGTVVIENRFAFPQVCLSEMSRLAVTGFSGVPSTYMILLNKSAVGDYDYPCLRYLTCAGGHLPLGYLDRLVEAFPGAQVFVMYGATEASGRISYVPPERLQAKRGSIGVPIKGVEMSVMRDSHPVPTYEEGEICARGDNFSAGYWPLNQPKDYLLCDGWYHTGDLGYRDSEGFFSLTGRINDFIKVGGNRVSAFEIEKALYELDCVRECAVVGCPDEYLGERAEAYVVPTNGDIVPEYILEKLRNHLPPYKTPSKIIIVNSLPKNESGKIMKKELCAAGEQPGLRDSCYKASCAQKSR